MPSSAAWLRLACESSLCGVRRCMRTHAMELARPLASDRYSGSGYVAVASLRGISFMNRLAQAIEKNGTGPLLGAATYFYDPTFLEIAALVGYQVAWIEMEHAFISFAEAADLCRIASGLGMLTMIRIPDTNRTTVLKAAECGPDILDLPMANSPEELREFVHHARFPPAGIRGFFSVSRAVGYGLAGKVSDVQQQLNSELCLMVQIETRQAVDRVTDLC